ncbi:MAG: CotH kinase family protein, partial [Cytophagaceae bacterium]
SNDMSVSSNYEYAKTKMDVENYAEFYAAEIFLNNTDWPGSNIRYWKTTNPYNPNAEYGQDGRWRWGLQDLDLTMGSDQPTGDYTYNALQKATMAGGTVWPNPDWSTTILRNLLRNPDFKNMFINTMADHMNSAVKTSRAISVIDRFTANIAAEMPAHISRWNAPYDMGFWNDQIDTLKQFAINRPRFQKTHIMQHFGITDTVHVTLHVSNTAQGKIRINTMDVDRDLPGVSAGVYPWTGTYFQNVPVSLHAIAYPGYRFVRWEGTVNSTDPVITLLNSGDEQVTAVFETASPFEPDKENVSLYPNPVSGTLNIEFTDDDNGDIYLFVYDRLGKQLYAAGVNKLTQTAIAHIDVSDFSKGLYILHVKSAKGTIYKKRFSVED